MKLYLSGANGMLGGYCLAKLSQGSHEIVTSIRQNFDLESPDSCYQDIIRNSPEVVIHMAAETNVDLCETDPAHGALYNSISTEAVARAAAAVGASVIYISTSNVFGQENRQSYNELDVPFPVNYYGKSKLVGEQMIRKHCPTHHLIIRAGWMIGGGKKDHKFVGKIFQQIKKGAETLTAVNDKFGSITPAYKLADFISWAIDSSLTGTFHYACKGAVSRFQIAKYMAERLGFKGEVVPVKSCNYPLPAPRPTFENIESVFLQSLKGSPPLVNYWTENLGEYINELES